MSSRCKRLVHMSVAIVNQLNSERSFKSLLRAFARLNVETGNGLNRSSWALDLSEITNKMTCVHTQWHSDAIEELRGATNGAERGEEGEGVC